MFCTLRKLRPATIVNAVRCRLHADSLQRRYRHGAAKVLGFVDQFLRILGKVGLLA
jgi:hypothetical protein